MKRAILTVLMLLVFYVTIKAQQNITWYTPRWVNGVCEHDSSHIFYRLPASMQTQVRPIVWDLSRHTAGQFLHFKTTARSFVIRYGLEKKAEGMPHMPATGVSGLDLYALDKNGVWNWAPANYKFGDTCTYSYRNMQVAAGATGADYYLYLPLYNAVQWLAVGVLQHEQFEFIGAREERPIVAYGTSIMQGAVASRPGLAWTNMLERNLDRMVINLGFSGNGRFEEPVFDLMAKVDAAVYVFDCMPNLTHNFSDAEIESRIRYGVNRLRQSHPEAALLFTEYPDGDIPFYTDSALLHQRHASSLLIAKVYATLKKEGVRNIYLLTEKEIGFDINSTTESTHPNDIGMLKYAVAYEKKIREILNEPKGDVITQQPVQQYRDGFNWIGRHEEVKAQIRQTNPDAILLGNSIVNYWGGIPQPERTALRGEASWGRYMQGVQNAGFGNDRIENLLWRVYHGELDPFKGRNILIMIGTNNLAVNTDEEIVAGLSFLLQQVKKRQPQAVITMLGILPRKGKESRVAILNKKISAALTGGDFKFADAGSLFLKGNQLQAGLFLDDGLHPNAAGYEVLGKFLRQLPAAAK